MKLLNSIAQHYRNSFSSLLQRAFHFPTNQDIGYPNIQPGHHRFTSSRITSRNCAVGIHSESYIWPSAMSWFPPCLLRTLASTSSSLTPPARLSGCPRSPSRRSQSSTTASRMLLTLTFVNPSTVSPIPSAKYCFPLYESCAIVAFRCHVG